MNTTLKNPIALNNASRVTALALSLLTSTTIIAATLIGITGCVDDAHSANPDVLAAAQLHLMSAPLPATTVAVVEDARLPVAAASDETPITTMETIGASPRD
jgi:hypothetical protein